MNDLDELGLSYDDLAAETARDNRPSFNHNPISWEGELVSITRGSETFNNGQEYPRHAFNFAKCKFVDVGNALDVYHDGDDFTLLIQPIEQGKAKRFSQLGKSTLASGQDLMKFVGQRVKVTEITETYKAANGYDRQSYHWCFAKVGEGSAAVAKPTEPSELGIEAAMELLRGGAVDRDTGEMTGKQWTEGAFAYASAKHPVINSDTVLLGKIADGSFIRDLVAAGTVIKGEDGLVVA